VQQALKEHSMRSRFTPPPLEILKKAFLKTQAIGSATCCLVFMDDHSKSIRSCNLGDSGFIIYRPNDREIIARSEFQCHDFNFPLQLGSGSSDLPEHSDIVDVPVQPDDWVVVASDGVWDNLFEEDIIKILDTCSNADAAADRISKTAYKMSLDPKRRSPFAVREQTQLQGYGSGGKPDDISVVVGRVRDPWAMRREDIPDSVAEIFEIDKIRQMQSDDMKLRLEQKQEKKKVNKEKYQRELLGLPPRKN
jgi:hypothetical protein